MRTKVALTMAVALVAGVAGCGGTTSPGANGTLPEANGTVPTAPARTGQHRTRASASKPRGKSCAARGITAPPFREGTCIQGGLRYVIVHGRSVLRLRTLSIALRGFAASEQLGSGSRAALPQQGAFVRVAARVKNETSSPQRFEAGQTLLEIGGQTYQERQEVEKRIDSRALGYLRRPPIPPGQSIEGELVFDLPPNELQNATSKGILYVLNFGSAAGDERGVFRIGQA